MTGLLLLLPVLVVGFYIVALALYNNHIDEREDRMTRLHNCPDCHCGPLGEAFAPRPATSSEWARREALRAAEAAVRAAKDARKKPAEETR